MRVWGEKRGDTISYVTFIVAQLHRLQGDALGYQQQLTKAYRICSRQNLFSLVKEWITIIEKHHLKNEKKTTETEIVEKLEIISNPILTFLPSYSACRSLSTSLTSIDNMKDKKEACEIIIERTASPTI